MNKKTIISTLLLAAVLLGSAFTYFVVIQDDKDSTAVNSEVSEDQANNDIDTLEGKTKDDLADTPEQDSTTTEDQSDTQDTVVDDDLVLPEPEGPNDFILLPVTTNHFEITQTALNSYSITLFAILNNPSQYDEYIDQLTQYKQEAIKFLEDNGYGPDLAELTYIPEEAESL